VIPLIAGIGIGTIYYTAVAISTAGTAGMSYATGRKVGRKACLFLDGMEDKVRSMVGNTFAPKIEE
jgi:hypothetical protein